MAVRPKKSIKHSQLMVRLDDESKKFLVEAADLRQISVSDYVRTVTVPQAKREIQAAKENLISLTPEEQLTFWQALHDPPKLTERQRRLGATMRGKS